MTPLNMELVNELKEKENILMRENSLLVEQTSVLAAGRQKNLYTSVTSVLLGNHIPNLSLFRIGREWRSIGGAFQPDS